MESQSEIPDCRIHYAQHDSIVIYHEGVPFESVFAHLCYRALAIPYITGMENTCADALRDNVAPKMCENRFKWHTFMINHNRIMLRIVNSAIGDFRLRLHS
jgi:hypothetical protein